MKSTLGAIIFLCICSVQNAVAAQCIDLFKAEHTKSDPGSERALMSSLQKVNFVQGPPAEAIRVIMSNSQSIANAMSRIFSRKQNDSFNEQQIEEIHRLQEGSYSSSIERTLNAFNIKYEVQYIERAEPDEFYLQGLFIKHYIITPDGSSPLNRFAKSFYEKYQTKLAYAPALNMAIHFTAAFDPERWMYLLQPDAIYEKNFADPVITAHEIKHAVFAAELQGLKAPIVQAPVHGFLRNKNAQNSALDAYAEYVSFQELVTVPISISGLAKQIEKKGLRASFVLFKTLDENINTLMKMSQRIQESSQVALVELEKAKNPKVKILQDQIEIELGPENTLTLKIISADTKDFAASPVKYAKNYLQKVIKLTQFNVKFLSDLKKKEVGTDGESFHLDDLALFKSSQVEFLENLMKAK